MDFKSAMFSEFQFLNFANLKSSHFKEHDSHHYTFEYGGHFFDVRDDFTFSKKLKDTFHLDDVLTLYYHKSVSVTPDVHDFILFLKHKGKFYKIELYVSLLPSLTLHCLIHECDQFFGILGNADDPILKDIFGEVDTYAKNIYAA